MFACMQVPTSPRWDDVRLFLEVFRAKNLADAGKRLGVDTSTVSRRLAALEGALGAALFERTRDGLAPTARAEELCVAAEAMEMGHRSFSFDASHFETEPEGLVRITAPPGLADAFVAPALTALFAKYPRLRVTLDASTQVVSLTRKEADIALRTVPSSGADLVTTKLADARWVLTGSPAYVASLGKLATMADARLVDWADDLAHLASARWLRKYAKGNEPVLRTSHFASQVAALVAGVGLAFVPEAYLPLYGLVRASLSPALAAAEAELPVDSVWLVGHRALRNVPRVAVVWDHLKDEMARFRERTLAALGRTSKKGKSLENKRRRGG